MKTIKTFFALFMVVAMPLNSLLAQNAYSNEKADVAASASVTSEMVSDHDALMNSVGYNHILPSFYFVVTIPASFQSQIIREDYDNQSIFSLKTESKTSVFLFSVTRVTGDQWMKIKDQVKNHTIVENKNGYITFAEKTTTREIKGTGNTRYQEVLREMDNMISSIQVK
jgi:hypothetical protein